MSEVLGHSGAVPRREGFSAFGFVLPAAAVYAVFVLLPICQSLYYSLFGGTFTPEGPFVGLENYYKLAADSLFWKALKHNLALVVLSLVVQIPLALGFAVVLTARIPGRSFLRAAYFVPMILPTPAIGHLWRLLLGEASPQLLGEADLAFWTLLGVVSWRHVGFHTVLLIAGMESIPTDIYDAARVDGASRWATFRHVTLPLSRPVIRICALLSVLGSLRYFDLAWILWLGGGGPDQSAELVATYLFRKAFLEQQMGYASTLAAALLVVSGVVALGMLALSRRAERREATWA